MSRAASATVRKRRSDAVSREDVVRLRLLRLSAHEIAAELGAKPDTVSGILQEPDVVAAVEEAERTALEDAQKGLRTLTRKAMRRLAELVESEDERISLAASTAILTKAGADAPTKSESKAEVTGKVEMTPADARAALEKRLEALSPEERELAERLLKR